MRLWRWFQRQAEETYITPWNDVIAEQHFANTERMLLGWHGQPKIVGDRVAEARERKLKEQREAEARAQLKIAR